MLPEMHEFPKFIKAIPPQVVEYVALGSSLACKNQGVAKEDQELLQLPRGTILTSAGCNIAVVITLSM